MASFVQTAEKTWRAVEARMSKTPTSEVVPEEAIATIEAVVMHNHDEAYDRFPTNTPEDRACRVQFWKDCILAAVPAEKAGLFAVYFHEYVAASLRGAAAVPVPTVFTDDEPSVIPNYGGEARAARDAYLACTAGD